MAPKKSRSSQSTEQSTEPTGSTVREAERLLVPIAARLLAAFRYKEANPGGDPSHLSRKVGEEMEIVRKIWRKFGFNSIRPPPPLTGPTIVCSMVREWNRAKQELRPPNYDTIIASNLIAAHCAALVATNPEVSTTIFVDPSVGGGDGPPTPELTPQLPTPRRSPRTAPAKKPLLPLIPLDIAIGVDQPRGTKRSAAVAEHLDEPDEDKGGDSEPGPRKVATSVGRRVRFQLPESRPKQRRRVEDDDPETTEAAPDELWVAVGEDRCNPCKLVGRQVCKPKLSAKGSCKSCVFCIGQSWPCNPPDSWLEKLSTHHQRRAQEKPHEASPPIIEKVVSKRQSGRQKSASPAVLDEDIHPSLSDRLHSVERILNENRAMLIALLNHSGVTPPPQDLNAAPANTSTHSTVPSSVTSHSPVPQDACTNSDISITSEESSEEVQAIGAASPISNDEHNLAARVAELESRLDRFEQGFEKHKTEVDRRLKNAGL